MALSLVVLIGIVVIVGIALLLAGGRGAGVIIGLLALLLVGGAGFFFLTARPPVVVATRPIAPVAAPAAVVTADAPVAETTRSIRGRVLRGAEGEAPFEGAVVEGPGGVNATTGPDGKFLLERIDPAEVRLRAVAPGFAGASVKVPADAKGEDVVLRLVPGAFLAGRILEREGRAPVAGAAISWEESATAISGPDGAFRLEPVPVGAGEFVVRAKGFARKKEAAKIPAAGLAGLDILLRPGTTASGTVFGPGDKPHPGATVEAVTIWDGPMGGAVPIPFETDGVVSGPDGKYLLEGLPVGRKVRVSASTGDMLAPPVEAGPLERSVPLEGVDLRLSPAAAVLATVLDGKGVPVAGARVTAAPAGEDDGGRSAMMMRVQVNRSGGGALTDERGIARVGPVAPGPVRVKVDKDDYKGAEALLAAPAGAETPVALVLDAGQSVGGKVLDPTGAPVPGAAITIQRYGAGNAISETRESKEDGTFRVGGIDGKGFMLRAEKAGFVTTSLNGIEAGKEDVVVTLQPGGAIAGVVTDPAGAPVGKFRILNRRKGDKPVNPMDWQRFAAAQGGQEFEDAGGRFRIEGLEAGSYEIEARAADLAPGRVADIAVVPGKDADGSVRLAAGLAIAGIVVRRTDGTPVEGARVKLPADGMFGEFDMGDFDPGTLDEDVGGGARASEALSGFPKGMVMTGPDGRFSLKGMEPGTVKLMVSATARGLAPASVKGIRVPSEGDVRVELAEESAIEGAVTDARGAPKAGVTIMLQRIPVFMRFATTDEQGRYRIGGIGPGKYQFYAMEGAGGGPSLNMKSETVTLEEGKATRKDHRLGEGTKVAGKVTRGGKPVGGVMVMLMPASRAGPAGALTGGGGGGMAMGSTKEDGTYEITGLSAGRYTSSIQTGMGGAPSGGEPLDVPAGATEVRHDIALPDTGIRGQVVDEEGRAVVGASVLALAAGGGSGKVTDMGSAMESIGGQTFTDDEGRFSLSGMKAGAWSIRVQAAGFGTEVVENVNAAEGAGTEARIVLHRGTEVTVRVVGPDGSPVAGANLFLADAAGREITNISQFDAVKTGEDGRAVVRAPSGTIQFEAAAAGYAPGEVQAEVPGGEVVIRLAKGAIVKVVVAGAGGTPVPGAGVEILDAAGKPYGQRFSMDALADLMGGSSSGSDGSWTRKDLPAGTWRVRAVLPDGRSGEERVVLAEGETSTVRITLR